MAAIRSPVSMASSGLWLPLGFLTSNMPVGTPAAAKLFASWLPGLLRRGAGNPACAAASPSMMPGSIGPGAAALRSPSSIGTPRRAATAATIPPSFASSDCRCAAE